MINILLAVLPLIQIKPPQLPPQQQRIVYTEQKPIVPSGSLHGQMIAYENMQRRINEVELQKYRRFREMIRETTPPVQTMYINERRYDSRVCSSYSGQHCSQQRKGFYTR